MLNAHASNLPLPHQAVQSTGGCQNSVGFTAPQFWVRVYLYV